MFRCLYRDIRGCGRYFAEAIRCCRKIGTRWRTQIQIRIFQKSIISMKSSSLFRAVIMRQTRKLTSCRRASLKSALPFKKYERQIKKNIWNSHAVLNLLIVVVLWYMYSMHVIIAPVCRFIYRVFLWYFTQ